MALDKKKSSLLTRIGIGIIAVMLVLAFVPWDSIGLTGGSGSNGSEGDGQMEAIAARYSATIGGNDQLLASDSTSYTVLVTQGNTYFDWAHEVQGLDTQNLEDRPIWTSASVFYGRALEVQPGDPSVATDYAISKYYSGDAEGAIVIVGEVMESSPDFAPAFFNAGIFYSSAGRSPEAVAAMTRYLELDPQGQSGDPEYARNIIAGTGQ